ncbi:MAG: helix-hairpin-helix domain-containing protein, partial [bacterium]
AAFEDKPLAARPAAMCGAFVALSNDSNAPFFNPAGLNLFNAVTLSFQQTSLYGEGDLKYTGAGFSVPTRAVGSFAFNSTSFGADFYKETELVFTHSIMMVPGGYFGYNIRQLKLKIEDAGEARALAFDVGAVGLVSQKLSFGFFSRGINNPQIAGDVYRDLTGGICFRPFRGMLTVFDITTPLDREENIMKIGCEMTVLPAFCVRFGIQPEPQRASFGFGFMLDFFDIDYAFVTHETLESQHLFSLAMRWGAKKETAAPSEYYKKSKKSKVKVSPKPRGTMEKVNINEADVKDLVTLPGIGKVTAGRIIDYRNAHGPFKNISDILNVPRFRKNQFEKIRDYILVGPPAKKGPEYAPPVVLEEKPEKKKIEKETPPEGETEKMIEETEETEEEVSREEKIENLKKQYYYKGLKLYQAKEYEEAIKTFRKLLMLEPTHPQSLYIIKKCEDALRTE